MTRTEDLRKQLLHQRSILLRRVAAAEDDLRWLDESVESERLEEGQERSLAAMLSRLDDRGIAEIGAIDRALARIAAGSYGVCADCDEPIPAARLAALPVADRCVACARG